jgi:ribulose-phosphate 3-epimerase
MGEVLYKVEDLRKAYPELDIQVDGGIVCDNVEQAAKAGANIIVSGTGICQHSNPQVAIKYMKDVVDNYIN